MGKCMALRVAGRSSVCRVKSQRHWEPGLVSQVWGTLPRETLVGVHLAVPGGPRVLTRNQPAPARTKAISWGPPPCSSIRKGVPLYGWKNRGIFTVVVTGWRGLRVCGHGGQLLAPWPHVSESHGCRGPLIQGCRGRAVLKRSPGHAPRQRGHLRPDRAPGKISNPDPLAPEDSPDSCPGACCCSPGP